MGRQESEQHPQTHIPVTCTCRADMEFVIITAVLLIHLAGADCPEDYYLCEKGANYSKYNYGNYLHEMMDYYEYEVNQDCIPQTSLCDNNVDCLDYADELNCTDPKILCMMSKCDDRIDCVDGADECGCNGSLYCNQGSTVKCVPMPLLCDGINHCHDGYDETRDCFVCTGNLNKVISTKLCDGNNDCGDVTASDECNCPTTARCDDRGCIQQWQLCDGIKHCSDGSDECRCNSTGSMFECLLSVSFHATKFSGNYCQIDKSWRSGTTCANMGFLCSLGAETSVIMLTIMTSSRLYSVYRPFNSHLTPRKTWIACICGWIFSIIFMLPPRLKRLHDYFASSVWFPNRFFHSDVVTKQDLIMFVKRLTLISQNMTQTSDTSWKYVEEIAKYHWPHNTHKFVTFSYFSKHSVCIPNMLATPNDAAIEYSLIVTMFNFIAILYVITAYVLIYKKATRKSKVLRTDKSCSSDARATAMQRRIFRLVASNILCWGPITVMAILRHCGGHLPNDVYAVTAIILLPINSAVNPILYSNLVNVSCNCLKKDKVPQFTEATSVTRVTTSV